MIQCLRLLLPLAAFVLVANTAVRAQEVQIPLDVNGQLTVVDAELESRLNMFPSYESFREARLFRQGEGAYVLVIQYVQDGSTVQDRRQLTETEVEALRQRITDAMAAANVRPALDQEGRVSLLWTAAGISLLAYGPSIVGVLDIENETSAGTIVLLTGAAGFFVPFYVTRSIPVTRAAASLTRSGSMIGYLHGAAIAALVGGERTTWRAVAGAGLATSLAEAVAAYRFATASDLGRGTVETMTSGSLFGAGIGLATAALILGEEFEDEDASIRTASGLGLLGSALGGYGGYRLSRAEQITRGDARIISTAGLLGVQSGFAVIEIADVRSTRPAAAGLIAATGAGLVAGHLLTRGRDFTTGQGNFVALGSLAGGLVGAAVSNIVGGSDAANAGLTTFGSLAGFSAMYLGYRGDAAEGSLNLSLAPSLDPVDRSLRPGFRLRAHL